MNNLKGFLYGIATSVTFGLIPLFTLPLMAKGLIFDSILFYRFLLATAALGAMMLLKKETFRIQMRDVPVLILLGLLYTGSAMFLFWGYNFMGAGVATLSIKGSELTLDPLGMLIVILSAMAYASYIIVVNKSRVRSMNGRKLAFYVFIVSTLLFAVKAMSNEGIQSVPDALSWMNLFLLAVVPTVISNITLVLAVHHIGGTLTSVLGAMEPVTAVCIGAFVFWEEFTWQSGLGILFIITAVTLIILSRTIQKTLSTVVRKIRPRHA